MRGASRLNSASTGRTIQACRMPTKMGGWTAWRTRADGELAYESIEAVYWHCGHTLGRDSYDGEGSQIEISSTWATTSGTAAQRVMDSGPGCQIIVRRRLSHADIVAHEFTHGVTDQTRPTWSTAAWPEPSTSTCRTCSESWWMTTTGGSATNCRATATGAAPGPRRARFVTWQIRRTATPERISTGTATPIHFPITSIRPSTPAVSACGGLAPGQDPEDSNDQGWVHTNSSIPNKAAYLVAAGRHTQRHHRHGPGARTPGPDSGTARWSGTCGIRFSIQGPALDDASGRKGHLRSGLERGMPGHQRARLGRHRRGRLRLRRRRQRPRG